MASVLCGLAPSVGLLVAARALQGVGAAALLPTTLATITATFPDSRERAQAIGIWAGVSALALASIVVIAPLAGRVSGRIGSRWLMAAGMAMAGVALLLLARVEPGTDYADIWWNLTLLGVGMALTMAPATAAIMGSVATARAGVASAVSNTSRQVGAVFGVAVLGAVLASRTRSVLTRALDGLGVGEEARARLRAPGSARWRATSTSEASIWRRCAAPSSPPT